MRFKKFLKEDNENSNIDPNSFNFQVGVTYRIVNLRDFEGRHAKIISEVPSNAGKMLRVIVDGTTTSIVVSAVNLQPVPIPSDTPTRNTKLSDVMLNPIPNGDGEFPNLPAADK